MTNILILSGTELWTILEPEFWKKTNDGNVSKENDCLVNVIASNNFEVKEYLKKKEVTHRKLFGLIKKKRTIYYSYIDVMKLKNPIYKKKLKIKSSPKIIDFCTYWVDAEPYGFRPYNPSKFNGKKGKILNVSLFLVPHVVEYILDSQKSYFSKYKRDNPELYEFVDKVGKIDHIPLDTKKLVVYPKKYKIPVIMHNTNVLEQGDTIRVVGMPIGWID